MNLNDNLKATYLSLLIYHNISIFLSYFRDYFDICTWFITAQSMKVYAKVNVYGSLKKCKKTRENTGNSAKILKFKTVVINVI